MISISHLGLFIRTLDSILGGEPAIQSPPSEEFSAGQKLHSTDEDSIVCVYVRMTFKVGMREGAEF